jgi:Fe-S-cluster containining protein
MSVPYIDLARLDLGVPGLDLPAALRELERVYRDLDATLAQSTATLPLPCRRGCDACCHQAVFLTQLEWWLVVDHAQRELSPAEWEAAVGQGLRIYAQHRALFDALDEPPPEGAPDHWEVARRLAYRCPLLGPAGACSVYPARELLARLYGGTWGRKAGELYACDLVHQALGGLELRLHDATGLSQRLVGLPLTGERRPYPWFFHATFG